ncbi:sec-independent protein translocase protein TatC [Halarchaeum rubridurum]|uniref:Sec-independent protein translocase protein TatC n=1 Tax=Halarchaeum rubridurum TaxID=489911 RepID=A0A830FLK9_9EURY|nr:twin-arginine translocase subunit TatC [Halarchaeum rubridurum]MBP1954309.1 sec-independent protein translocase protein TatC [Halarchaeum rubridurum]GGM59011.1 Sec-independent protein translocase TatC [Halarchaeum rubridurum]
MSDSGVISEDTARAVDKGRETIGVFVGAARKRLQVVFIAFVVGLFGGIMAMRTYIWPALKRDLITKLGLDSSVEVIFQTPFDVILLQVKIGMVVGVLLALPILLYFAKAPLAERDIVPDVSLSLWHLAGGALVALFLAFVGVAYAYELFFPLMFEFLAGNAMSANIKPMYSIVAWTQFILVLAISFGVAAQLPLVMTALSYLDVVPYETFRDYWKHAVVAIFIFGGLFSPPDPFTQIMWAVPLLFLYAISLYLAKVVTLARRGSERIDLRAQLRSRWNVLAGSAVVGFLLGYGFFGYGGVSAVNGALAAVAAADLPLVGGAFDTFAASGVPSAADLVGLGADASLAVVGVAVAFFVLVVALAYAVYDAIAAAARAESAVYGGRAPKPENMNLDVLDAAGVRAAPDERFDAMDEAEALSLANAAMEADDPEKAGAILDRFDAAEARAKAEAAESEGEGDGATTAEGEGEPDEAEGEGEASGNVFSRTSAGMLDAFTDEETTEDDIGGYYHDLQFIVGSLRSRLFWLVGWFMLVLAVVFGFLYQGGLGFVRDDFIGRIPAEALQGNPEALGWPVALHPVEALIFSVKLSTVVAAVASVPLVLFFVWPALRERGFIAARRGVVTVWAGAITVTIVAGSVLGYIFVAPSIISYLVWDALQAQVIISYRISDFLWLVFMTTAGIGLLATVPVTMWLAHWSGVVGYPSMRRRWRVFVIAAFGFAALVTPDSLYTMVVVGAPIAIAFFLGLAGLWVVTLGGRRGGGGASPDDPAPDERPA